MKTTRDSSSRLSLTIPEPLNGQRLDAALATLTDFSRSKVQALIKEGHLYSEHGVRPSQKVYEGDLFQLTIPSTVPLDLQPEAIPLDILFEDEHLLVINKPAHMVVHPSAGHDSGTLVHALLHHCQTLPGINGVERPGIVHRLDKGTSGSLVVAKSEAAHTGLSKLFATHDIDRQYIAWSRGSVSWQQQRIEQPIGRHPQNRQKMAINPQGKMAITDIAIEQNFAQRFCRIRLTLQTGRTHQIRVHLTHMQLPILGDATYGRHFNPGKQISPEVSAAIQSLNHQALHAEVLGFQHPISNEYIHCIAPLPHDLTQLDLALRQHYS
ncbi:MAG: RluA family pseudouridine synthase [Zetaproteobacteria bacterium]|nr:RluA family pseudouridine synthase [Zetaproteobacteria bacterium]